MLAAVQMSELLQLLLVGVVALALFIAVGRARERVIFALVAQELKAHLSRYVPATLLSALEDDPERLNLHESRVAVLLIDIRGFTSFAERRPLPEVVRLLTEFRSLTSGIVERHGGMVDKFMGDATLALFGILGKRISEPARAIDCGQAIVQAVEGWNEERGRRGEPPVGLAVAVHFGRVMAGVIGDETRVEYTAIGDTVNTASRMLGLCRTIGTTLLVSKDALAAAGLLPARGWLALAPEYLRGRTRPIDLYVPAQVSRAESEAVQ
jgi:adenylate cyclase